jgi:hypothetical protein
MDPAALLTAPVIAVALGLVIVSALIGYAVGRSNENERKEIALKQADEASKAALENLRVESEERLEVLTKASHNDLEQLKHSHRQQVEQLNQAHQALVDSLKATHSGEIERLNREHSGLIDRLNATNSDNINALEQRRQSELQEVKSDAANNFADLKREHKEAIEGMRAEHAQALEALRKDHEQALRDLRDDRDRRLRELEQQHAAEQQRLTAQLAELKAERDNRGSIIAGLEETVTELRAEIKDAKMNNMFSVSKSGEKLVRVVRSVQELASELDETSRTVTGGEYSFFDEIKDQRDRETVLRLTASGQTFAHDQSAAQPTVETAAAEADVDGEGGDVVDSWLDKPDTQDEQPGEGKTH